MKTLNLVDRAVRGGWGMSAVPLALALLLASHPAHAQRMPQDSWYLAKEVPAGGGGKFNYPYDVAVGPDGNIYVADYGNQRIQVLDSEGTVLRSWNGFSADVPNNSFYPRSLHVALDGKVYVADQNNHRVLVFDAQGKFLRSIGQYGVGEGHLIYPIAIAVDSDGIIYVGDANSFISAFDSQGTYLRRWNDGFSGSGIRQIHIVAGNKIAVLEANNGRSLKIYNSDGTFSSRIDGLYGPYSFTTDSSGNYFFAGDPYGQSTFQIWSNAGQKLEQFQLQQNITNEIFGIAVTGNRIYLADRSVHKIGILDIEGNFLTSSGRFGNAYSVITYSLTVDSLGNFYLGDFDNSEIRKYDPDWKLLKKIGSEGNGNGQFGGLRDLAVGANGTRLYALEQNNNRVQIFDLDGNYVGKFGGPGSGNGQFNMPSGITAGKDGKVYVADRDNHRVQVFSSAGAHIGSFGSQGSFDGQFQSPYDVAAFPNGDVAVADYGNKRVQIFDHEGKFLRKKNYLDLAREGMWEVRDEGDRNQPEFVFATQDGLLGISAKTYQRMGSYLGKWIYEHFYSYPVVLSDSQLNGIKAWMPLNLLTGKDVNEWEENYYYSHDNLAGPMAESKSGDLIVANGDGKIRVWKRTFRTVHPEPANALPLPTIVSQKRRPGTALVDVDYTVKDADNATVQTAALAFKNGGNSLSDVIPITSFADGTGSKLGANIATGQTHRFTWDVARDWSTDFGEVQLEILAKDGRDLLNLDFIQIPATGNQTALKISRTPLTDNDLLSVWYWLIATGDAGVHLENGQVYRPVESFDEGLWGAYHQNNNFDVLRFSRGGDIPFVGVGDYDVEGAYSIRWSGYFYPQKTGQYSFRFEVEDVASIWVGGSQVVTDNSPTQFSINAQAGVRIPIRIDWDNRNHYRRYFTLYLTPPSEPERSVVKSDFQWAAPMASVKRTYPSGRAFLFQKMGLREATAEEVTRAKEAGTPGVINQWEPKLRVGPDERPVKINAYGFDTGAAGPWEFYWVVPVSGN